VCQLLGATPRRRSENTNRQAKTHQDVKGV
jgi:hypothetical protein